MNAYLYASLLPGKYYRLMSDSCPRFVDWKRQAQSVGYDVARFLPRDIVPDMTYNLIHQHPIFRLNNLTGPAAATTRFTSR